MPDGGTASLDPHVQEQYERDMREREVSVEIHHCEKAATGNRECSRSPPRRVPDARGDGTQAEPHGTSQSEKSDDFTEPWQDVLSMLP